jgi:hypothetical protein
MNKILAIPEGFETESNSQSFVISYKWYKLVVWFLLLFVLLWNSFLVGWFMADTPWFFKAFAIIHLAAGVGLTWYVVCLFLNKTIISITKNELTIQHLPIPFPSYKNVTFNRFDIQQVYITRLIRTNKGSTTISFALHILTAKNKSIKLSVDCDSYEKAIFIKRKVEEYMRIDPQPIEGEYVENS